MTYSRAPASFNCAGEEIGGLPTHLHQGPGRRFWFFTLKVWQACSSPTPSARRPGTRSDTQPLPAAANRFVCRRLPAILRFSKPRRYVRRSVFRSHRFPLRLFLQAAGTEPGDGPVYCREYLCPNPSRLAHHHWGRAFARSRSGIVLSPKSPN